MSPALCSPLGPAAWRLTPSAMWGPCAGIRRGPALTPLIREALLGSAVLEHAWCFRVARLRLTGVCERQASSLCLVESLQCGLPAGSMCPFDPLHGICRLKRRCPSLQWWPPHSGSCLWTWAGAALSQPAQLPEHAACLPGVDSCHASALQHPHYTLCSAECNVVSCL